MKPILTIDLLQSEATKFALISHRESSLYGVTDGKAIGTYLEHKFRQLLSDSYTFEQGSSAKGIDFPSLNVDMGDYNIEESLTKLGLSMGSCA